MNPFLTRKPPFERIDADNWKLRLLHLGLFRNPIGVCLWLEMLGLSLGCWFYRR